MTAKASTERDRWFGIEIRHLEALDAVARLGSFVAAAHELGYVSSAISQQIDYLERLVGQRLVERGRAGRALELTRPGELFLAHAREVLRELRVAERGLDNRSEQGGTRLRIGYPARLAGRSDGSIVEALAGALGDGIDSVHRWDGDPLCALDSGKLDAVVDELPVPAERYCSVEVRRDRLVLAVPADWPAASAGCLSPQELAGLTLVEIACCPTTRALRTELEARGVAADWRFRVESAAAARTLVIAGLAAAVLPEREVDDGTLRAVGLVGLDRLALERAEGVVWLRAREGDPSLERLRAAARCLAARSTGWRDARAA